MGWGSNEQSDFLKWQFTWNQHFIHIIHWTQLLAILMFSIYLLGWGEKKNGLIGYTQTLPPSFFSKLFLLLFKDYCDILINQYNNRVLISSLATWHEQCTLAGNKWNMLSVNMQLCSKHICYWRIYTFLSCLLSMCIGIFLLPSFYFLKYLFCSSVSCEVLPAGSSAPQTVRSTVRLRYRHNHSNYALLWSSRRWLEADVFRWTHFHNTFIS